MTSTRRTKCSCVSRPVAEARLERSRHTAIQRRVFARYASATSPPRLAAFPRAAWTLRTGVTGWPSASMPRAYTPLPGRPSAAVRYHATTPRPLRGSSAIDGLETEEPLTNGLPPYTTRSTGDIARVGPKVPAARTTTATAADGNPTGAGMLVDGASTPLTAATIQPPTRGRLTTL